MEYFACYRELEITMGSKFAVGCEVHSLKQGAKSNRVVFSKDQLWENLSFRAMSDSDDYLIHLRANLWEF